MIDSLSRVAGFGVSRETFEALTAYVAMIEKWNPAINLIARSTVSEIWSRHILDSAQLARFLDPEVRIWADFGSGGGLPGLVLAILARQQAPDTAFHLVESDQRKATFLRQVTQSLGLKIEVHVCRVEALEPLSADVVSARALAPLEVLCGFAARHLKPGGIACFPKGARYEHEVAEARRSWQFELEEIASATLDDARLLKLTAIHHV